MSKIYDARMKLEKHIVEKKLDAAKTKGSIGLKSGLCLALIGPDSPDDPAKLDQLRRATKLVLNIDL